MRKMLFVFVGLVAATLSYAQLCVNQTQLSGPFSPDNYYSASVSGSAVQYDQGINYLKWKTTGAMLPKRANCNCLDVYNSYISAPAIVLPASLCSAGDTLQNPNADSCEVRYVILVINPYNPCDRGGRCGGPFNQPDTVLLINKSEPYKVYLNRVLTNPGTITATQKEYSLRTRGYSLEVIVKDTITNCSDTTWICSPSTLALGACGEENPILQVTKVDVKCHDETNGRISLGVVGGMAPFVFHIANVNTTSFNNLPAGTYPCGVRDALGKTDSALVVIAEPDSISVTMSQTRQTCWNRIDGSLDIHITGGTPTYRVDFYQGIPWGVWISRTNTNDTLSFTSLSPGGYRVSVTDQNGCIGRGQISIPISDFDIEAIGVDPSCHGESDGHLSIQLSGGVTPYLLTFGPHIAGCYRDSMTVTDTVPLVFDSLPSGTYRYHAVDATGCVLPQWNNQCSGESFYLRNPDPVEMDTRIKYPILCFGDTGLVVLSPNPNVIVQWSDGNDSTRRWVHADTYHFSLTDTVTGCTGTDSLVVPEPGEYALQITVTNAPCAETSGRLDMRLVRGGLPVDPFYWYQFFIKTLDGVSVLRPYEGDGHGFFSKSLSAGTYEISIGTSCGILKDTVTILEPSLLEFQWEQRSFCGNDSMAPIFLSAQGGTPPYVFYESSTSASVDSLVLIPVNTPLVYEVKDSMGCRQGQEIYVDQSFLVPYELSVRPTCRDIPNGSIEVNNLPINYRVIWSDGGNEILRDSLTAGDYLLTISDSVCTYQETVSVDSFPGLIVSIQVDEAGCFGDVVTATVVHDPSQEIASYEWTNHETTGTAHFTDQGQYKVLITDVHGCRALLEGYATIPDSLFVIIDTVGDTWNALGYGGNPPYTYRWSTGAETEGIQKPTVSGEYDVSVTDANGCIATWSEGMQITSILETTGLCIEVFPNPTTGKIFMKFSEYWKQQGEMRDLLGQWVGSFEINGNEGQLDISNLPSGLYFIRFNNHTKVFRVVKTE